jgi:hypothetical protein
MTVKNPHGYEQRLGGGLVLLPGDAEPFPTESFALYKAFSLDDRTFCVEPGFVFDTITRLNLSRLDDICQLQLLSVAEVVDEPRRIELPHIFSHKRLTHSLRAAALHGIMAAQCGFSREETAVGILAECMHDGFICAGGDSWKEINCQQTLFDEDDKFAEKIFRYHDSNWRLFCRKYGFISEQTAKTLDDIVSGRGLRGQIHEVADTASYMLGDLAEIKKAHARLGGRNLQQILLASQDEWDVWNYVKIAGGKLTATNHLVLGNFLRLRTILWMRLYNNPAVKFLELLCREIIYPYLINRKRIDLAELPKLNDGWLYGLAEQEMGLAAGALSRLDLLGAFPRRAFCVTWSQAMDFEDQFYSRENSFTLVFSTKDFPKTKSKTDKYYVRGLDGKTAAFKDAYPTDSEQIETIIQESISHAFPAQIYWVEKPVIPDNLRQAWEEARARWQKR